MSSTRSRAFTLLEMMIVVVILGVLASLVIPRVAANVAEGKRRMCSQNTATINTMVEKWYMVGGTWPSDTLADIGNDPGYFPNGIPACPVNGSKYALDKTTHRVTEHKHPLSAPEGAIERMISPTLP